MIEAKTTLKEGFWILEKKSKPFFQHCSWKKTLATPPISPLRGFKETNSFSFVGQMECFFWSLGRRNQNGGIFCFSNSVSALLNTIDQHICHFSTRFMLKSTYATRTTRTVFYTIETEHLSYTTSCFKILTSRAKHQNKIAKKSN